MNTHTPKILVTRPEKQSVNLREELSRRGYSVINLPLIEIQDIPVTLTDENIDLVIFTSRNAVQFAAANPSLKYLFSRTANLSYAAIGNATKDQLKKNHVSKIITGRHDFTSEELLQNKAFAEVSGKKILIVKGVSGRTYLGDTLKERGAELRYIEVYQRKPISYGQEFLNQEIINQFNLGMITSAEILDQYIKLLSPVQKNLFSIPLIAGSQRISQLALSKGFNQVLQADNPGDSAMLKILANRFPAQQ
ncbi:MAG: uroporphyrinogen-III synthase [Thiotrichales bacterium]